LRSVSIVSLTALEAGENPLDMTTPAIRHVIFLGAGASASSGYPLANELRLRISSMSHFRRAITMAYHSYEKANGRFKPDWKEGEHPEPDYMRDAIFFATANASAITLFRRGGFASVDEFCKLVGKEPEHRFKVSQMRFLTRFVLGLVHPEQKFQDSDYYPFVQRLFDETLYGLRDDVTVISFNYDPYLEYILLRALEERTNLKNKKLSTSNRNQVTSGFFDHSDLSWVKHAGQFAFLKLHGTICHPNGAKLSFSDFFESDPKEQFANLSTSTKAEETPPIVFPWDVFDENGELLKKSDDFALGLDPAYLPLFQGIWTRARDAVQQARKISFVGLSMHPFLTDAMRFLFKGKRCQSGQVRITVANRDNEVFQRQGMADVDKQPHYSPARKVMGLLTDICPGLDVESVITDSGSVSMFTALNTFQEFIEKEMEPSVRLADFGQPQGN
jgi:hypothetical protein